MVEEQESKHLKVIAYMRVSMRTGMTVENQRPVIEKWLEINKKDIDTVAWMEETESTRNIRPVRDAAIELLKEKKYNTIVCVRLDRFGRSVKEITETIDSLLPIGVRFIFISNNFDFHDSMDASARLQLHIFSAFAEFERELIRERIKDSQHRAWVIEKKQKGRPKGAKDKRRRDSRGYTNRWLREKAKDNAKKEDIKWQATKQL